MNARRRSFDAFDRPRPSTTASTEEFGEELVVYCERTQRMHCLDRQASIIWALCDGRRDLGSIATETTQVLGIDSEALREDVKKTVERFRALGLLR